MVFKREPVDWVTDQQAGRPDERAEIEAIFLEALIELELDDMNPPIRCGWAYYFEDEKTQTLTKTPYLTICNATKQEVSDILATIEEYR